MRLLFVLFIYPIMLFSQNNYYVSPSGNNSNKGNLTNPWLTIQYSVDQLSPGDTLNILAGTYYEKINFNVSGNTGQPITIRAYQGQNAVIDASNHADSDPLFYINNKSYIHIEGLHFTNNYDTNGVGLLCEGKGIGYEIINCKFSNIAISTDPNYPVTYETNMPVLLFRGNDVSNDSLSNILIQGCEVYDCRPGYSECIAVSGNLSGFTIIDNYIHDNKNIGICVGGNYNESPNPTLDHARNGLIKNNICNNNLADYSASAGIYVDGGEYVIVENNISHHNGYGGEIGCEESGNCSYIIFRDNIFYLNERVGMHIGGYDTTTGGYVEFSKILNNTFYFNDTDEDGNGEILFTQFENGEVSNNIFYISSQNYFISNDRSQPNLTMNYNLVFNDDGADSIIAYWNGNDIVGLSNIYSTIGIGVNDTYGDPNFNNVSNSDFHIQQGSPAYNAGDTSFIAGVNEVDIDGEARVNNGIVDCGADEYYVTTSVDNDFNNNIIKSFNLEQIFPNPFYQKTIINYHVFSKSNVKLVIYNVLGQEVCILINNILQPGHYSVNFNATGISSGIYFAQLTSGDFQQIQKMILVK